MPERVTTARVRTNEEVQRGRMEVSELFLAEAVEEAGGGILLCRIWCNQT